MSRRDSNMEGARHPLAWSDEDREAVEQSLDIQMITHAKRLLCTLWKQSRITIGVRSAGESALSAALEAVEHPHRRAVNFRDGQQLSNDQWLKEQGRRDEPF